MAGKDRNKVRGSEKKARTSESTKSSSRHHGERSASGDHTPHRRRHRYPDQEHDGQSTQTRSSQEASGFRDMIQATNPGEDVGHFTAHSGGFPGDDFQYDNELSIDEELDSRIQEDEFSRQGTFQATGAPQGYDNPSSYDDLLQGVDNMHLQEEQDVSYQSYTPSQNYSSRRHIPGNPATGEKEQLDPSYKMRRNDWKTFFKPGRVFMTLWTEGLGGTGSKENNTFISEVAHGQHAFSKVRRFVVVRYKKGHNYCSCLPVTSYDGRGLKKHGINIEEHGFIHSKSSFTQTHSGIKRPIKINLARNIPAISPGSLVHYGKVYTVETNVKVKDIGLVEGEYLRSLKINFDEVFQADNDDEQSISTSQDQYITGAGGITEDYAAPPEVFSPNTSTYPMASTMSSTNGMASLDPNYVTRSDYYSPAYQQNNQFVDHPQGQNGYQLPYGRPEYPRTIPTQYAGESSGFSTEQEPFQYAQFDHYYGQSPMN